MNFDPVAQHYQRLEHLAFGRSLEHCRTALLQNISPPPRKALLLGEGDGRFLERLLQAFPEIQVEVVEASRRMIRIAKQRVVRHPSAARVQFHQADAMTVDLRTAEYDLVVTHFFLDVLSEGELRSLTERIRQASAPHAFWLVSEFQLVRDSVWWRLITRGCIRLMYAFFRVTTGLEVSAIPDYPPVFTRSGMRRCKQVTALAGFLTSELWRIT